MTEELMQAGRLPFREELLDLSALTPKIQWAYRYWKDRIRDGNLPGRNDLVTEEMLAILPNIILLDVQQDPLDFHYRLIGTEIDRHSQKYHTGHWMSEIPERKSPSTVWDNCSSVVLSRQPSSRSIPYIGPHRDFASTCQITLPLATDGLSVDMLFIVIDYVGSDMPHFTSSHQTVDQPFQAD